MYCVYCEQDGLRVAADFVCVECGVASCVSHGDTVREVCGPCLDECGTCHTALNQCRCRG